MQSSLLHEGDIKLIVKIAGNLIKTSCLCRQRIGTEVEAYVAIGWLALQKAKKKYNKDRSSWSTYASKVIRRDILNEAWSSSIIYVSDSIRKQANRVNQGLKPTKKCSNQSIEAALRVFDKYWSNLSEETDGNISKKYLDLDEYIEQEEYSYQVNKLKEAITHLPPHRQEAITRYFGLDGNNQMNFREI